MTVENIPDPNDFTKEIEGTIDNLFNPTKKIVIDPLTNEVKEVEEANSLILEEEKKAKESEIATPVLEEDHQRENKETKEQISKDEILLSEPTSIEVESEQTIETKEDKNILELEPETLNLTETQTEQLEDDTDELEFELELEAEEDTTTSLSVEGEEPNYTNENLKLTEKLEQVVLTVEWEITPKLVEEALKLVKQLKENISNEDIKTSELLGLMEGILEHLLVSPDKLPTNAPIILKQGVKVLKKLVTDEHLTSQDELDNTLDELKKILKPPKQPKKDRQDNIELKTQHKETNKLDDSTTQHHDNTVDIRIQNLLLKTIEKQLKILDDCIDKILPVELTLSKTKEAEKLYLFHKTLREELEHQYNYIVENLEKFKLLPKDFKKRERKQIPSSAPIKDLIKKEEVALCPWTRLLGINWNNRFSAIPPEVEIVYNGPIPRKAKNQTKSSNVLELSKFKAWPWTKIKGMFSGTLSQKSEEELRAITVPIIDNPTASKLFGSERIGNHLIILNTNKGLCAIVSEGPPEEIPGPFDKNWQPEKGKDNPVVGYIKQGEQKIPVIAPERLL